MQGKYLGLGLATVGIWSAVAVVALSGAHNAVASIGFYAAVATFFMFLFTS